jgi:hypothetical protein
MSACAKISLQMLTDFFADRLVHRPCRKQGKGEEVEVGVMLCMCESEAIVSVQLCVYIGLK